MRRRPTVQVGGWGTRVFDILQGGSSRAQTAVFSFFVFQFFGVLQFLTCLFTCSLVFWSLVGWRPQVRFLKALTRQLVFKFPPTFLPLRAKRETGRYHVHRWNVDDLMAAALPHHVSSSIQMELTLLLERPCS